MLWRASEPVILASRSQARQAMLRAAGVAFEAVDSAIDERATEASIADSDPAQIALHLAIAKAQAVSVMHPHRYVIGADQTLALGSARFSKPKTRADAQNHLQRLSGQAHALHSAFALVRGGHFLAGEVQSAHLHMRQLSPDFIAHYLDAAADAVLGSVGAYQLEGLGVHLFDKIEGDHSTILGLPLIELLAFLRRHGSLAS